MELRHLRYFIAVAEELSFSRAAKRLGIAQPPLSQQIRALESEIELRLFDRSSRKISLTLAGKEFALDARRVLESVSDLERKAKLRSQGDSGKISIGVITSIATPAFASMLRSFQKKNPGVELSLVDQPSIHQIESLLSGEIDIGFLRPSPNLPSSLESHLIKNEPLKLAVPDTHPLARRRRIDWKDLSGESLILIRPEIAPEYYNEFYNRCRAAGVEPRASQYASNVATQLWLVSAGMGVAPIAITPEFVNKDRLAFIALPSDAPVYQTAMVWRKGDLSPALRKFMKMTRETVD